MNKVFKTIDGEIVDIVSHTLKNIRRISNYRYSCRDRFSKP